VSTPELPAEWLPPAVPFVPAAEPQAAPTAPPGSAGPGGWHPPMALDEAPTPFLVPARRRRKRRFITALAALLVLIVAAGALGGWRYLHRDIAFNYGGKQVDRPADALAKAEAGVATVIAHQPHTLGSRNQCYFGIPSTGSQKHRADVSGGIYCGQVMLLDSEPGRWFLHYSVEADAGTSHVQLSFSATPDTSTTYALPAGLELARPGSTSRRTKFAPIKAPVAPPTTQDAFLSVDTVGKGKDTGLSPDWQKNDMAGNEGDVTLESDAIVPYYDKGNQARSAANGQELIAFTASFEAYDGETLKDLDVGVSVDGASPRNIPAITTTTQYKVISVPTKATSVDLVLKSAGTTQKISLLTGKPGADNIVVTARRNWRDQLAVKKDLPFTAANQGGASVATTLHLTVNEADLEYFATTEAGIVTPNDPQAAWLFVDLQYTTDMDNYTGYDLDPELMKLKLADGSVVRAKNINSATKPYYVFKVPANITSATFMIGGSEGLGSLNVQLGTDSVPLKFAEG
jgi:hypothetical protein